MQRGIADPLSHAHTPPTSPPTHFIIQLSSWLSTAHDAGIHASLITRVPAFVHSKSGVAMSLGWQKRRRRNVDSDADDGSIAIAHSAGSRS